MQAHAIVMLFEPSLGWNKHFCGIVELRFDVGKFFENFTPE